MKILVIDDLRNLRSELADDAENEIYVARTSSEAMDKIKSNPEGFDRVFFDHDLGGEDTTRPVALYLEERAFLDDRYPVGRIIIHTSNSVGRKWLYDALNKEYFTDLIDAADYFYN